MIGGVATQRTRKPKRRSKQRRQFRGALRAGELACTRGAWVVTIATDGTPSEPSWDAALRLYANRGDVLVVIGDDVAAMRVVGIAEPGWNERWRVETVYGRCADGSVLVMSGRGLQRARRPRKPGRRSLASVIAERARDAARPVTANKQQSAQSAEGDAS